MVRLTALFHAYLLLLLAFLVYSLSPGLMVTDEGAYALMAKSLAVDGQFQIWNGLNETFSPELKIPSTVFVYNANEARLYGIPAPLYPVLAWPFYRGFGLWGLHLMNVLGFVWVTFIIYHLYMLLFHDKRGAFFSAVLYSAGSYSLQYAQMLLPHTFSAAIVLSSVYLAVRCFIKGLDNPLYFFLIGLISGVGVGVRYPNGGFSVLIAAFIYYRMRGGFQPFLTGFLAIALPITVFNTYVFGGIIETGYTLTPWILPLAVVLVSCAAVFVFWRVLLGRTASFSGFTAWLEKHAVVFILLIALVAFFFEPVRLIFIYFLSKVFYLDLLPSGVAPVFFKRALFQSTPFLALSLLAPFLMVRSGIDRGLAYLLFAVAFFEPFVYSSVYAHGGSDETFGMRYFLDGVPYLAVLSVYVMSRIYTRVSRPGVAVSVALSLLLARDMAFNNEVYSGLFYRALPVAFALLLLAIGTLALKSKSYPTAFMLVLFLSVSYSASVAFSDYYISFSWRSGYNDASEILLSNVKDGSALFYYRREEAVTLDYVKLYKDVRIVAASVDGGKDTARMLRFYNSRGIPIYVNALGNSAWANWTYDYALKNNLSNVELLRWY